MHALPHLTNYFKSLWSSHRGKTTLVEMGLATETTSDSCFPGSACMDAEAMVSTSVASNSDVEFSTNHFDTLCGFFRVRVQPGIHFDDFATQFCKKK
jgi:hypothetical protein